MSDLIHDRKASEKKEERHDLFSSLLDANDNEDPSEAESKLSTRELFGALSFCPVYYSIKSSDFKAIFLYSSLPVMRFVARFSPMVLFKLCIRPRPTLCV